MRFSNGCSRRVYARRLAGLAWLYASLTPAAYGANVQDRLEDLEPLVQDTSIKAEALFQQVAPGVGYISKTEAVQRFEELLYLSMLGEHQASAEGFFGLVTSGALSDQGLHRDAEWYLADSLFQLGNYATAESQFQVVADDPQHPFRDDAVRRLLELYALTGDQERFKQLYAQEIATGRVSPTDLIVYSVAKSFYVAGDKAGARSQFGAIGPESAYYGKARYFLGALAVEQDDLAAAAPLFEEVANLSVETADDRRVQDLALLALGRIYYEQQDYLRAAEYYGRIAADSEYAAEKLYEISWTFIRSEAWQDALRGIDIFLLAYPDHHYAANMKVIKGKLHLADVQYEDALTTFEQVITDYTPVRDRFTELANASIDRAYFQEMVDLSQAEGEGALPPYAVSMMKADPDLSRAITVFTELRDQAKGIATSEEIIGELKLALGTGAHIGGFERMRYDALSTSWAGIDEMLMLLEIEDTWQKQTTADARASALPDLTQRRSILAKRAADLSASASNDRAALEEAELQVRRLHREALTVRDEAANFGRQIEALKRTLAVDVSAAGDGRQAMLDELARLQQDMDSAIREAEAIEARLSQIQAPTGGGQPKGMLTDAELSLLQDLETLRLDYGRNREPSADATIAKRLDASYVALGNAQERLQSVYNNLDRVERLELGRIQERFQQEVEDVARQHVDHDALLTEAETVSAALTRDGFGRLEDFFARSVLDADLGAVDVYWAQKIEVSDEMTRVAEERQALLEELTQRFDLIKQKIGK